MRKWYTERASDQCKDSQPVSGKSRILTESVLFQKEKEEKKESKERKEGRKEGSEGVREGRKGGREGRKGRKGGREGQR
jgi:hypothetical protein